ncbi:MAG: Hcp family type VI secretion system effector [Chitinispirillia bacterium]|nr:Hcp family type VI secretion system effector [Chitinispirillia bacterium]MCL2242256.1 Hcp family type VI secretion system effector [Chitinispirillia bacterium]
MPTPAYMWMKDNSGNSVDGSVDVSGREKSVEIFEFEHEVRIPTDPDTGKLTGTRKHEAIRLLKAFDASSPYLYKAACEGQTFSEVEIKWYRIDDSGTETEYFSHKLENVKVCSVHPIMYNVKDSSKEKFEHMEEVKLRYQKITWTYADGNLQASDSWKDGR